MASKSKYGLTVWGAWFVEALKRFDENGRLSRGMTYANTGKVSLMKTTAGLVNAKVKGRSYPWYKVSIKFTALAPDQITALKELIEAEPMLLARIEAGELPNELLDRLKERRIQLIPSAWNEMERNCSCPDWGDPCKHMAAVYYMIAKEIDADPRILFRLRGVDLDQIFGHRASVTLPLPFDWKAAISAKPVEQTPPTPNIPELENFTAFISALLPSQPVFCQEDFTPILIDFYHYSIRASSRLTEFTDLKTERRFSAADYQFWVDCGKKLSFPFGQARPPIINIVFADGQREQLSFGKAFQLFIDFADDNGTESYRFLFHFFRALLAIIQANAFIPAPLVSKASSLTILWRPLTAATILEGLKTELVNFGPPPLTNYQGNALSIAAESRLELALTAGLTDWVRALGFQPSNERAALRPFIELFFNGGCMDLSKPGEGGLAQAIAAWLAVLNIDFGVYKYRLKIDLSKNKPANDDSERPSYSLALAVGRNQLKIAVPNVPPADSQTTFTKQPSFVPLKDAAKHFGSLDALTPAAALGNYLPELKDLARLRKVDVDESRLAAFLGETTILLSRLGVEIILPKVLRNRLKPRLVISAQRRQNGNLKSYFDLGELLSFDWRIAIGDTILDAAAFEALLRDKRAIISFKDGFVALNPSEAAQLLALAKQRAKPRLFEAIQARLAGDAVFTADAEAVAAALSVENCYQLPSNFLATLRPYQERGFNWILSNLALGFGCILADDMGLGKTVQAIAVLSALAAEGRLSKGTLLVVPAALMTNWERELTRFAPDFTVERYHGAQRSLGSPSSSSTIRLTTYQTATRDEEKFKAVNFSLLIVDEAHLLKNADSRQSRAIKGLRTERVLALSGTPVENRLEDLRSIFDLIIPGYLGSQTEFKNRWRLPIEANRDKLAAEKLKRITAPFLLRRLKTDSSIISDLPDKIQTDEYAVMTSTQAALYEGIVSKGLEEAETAVDDPLRRGAIILKLITALKQVCDHPRVYDTSSPADVALSGKTILLMELLTTILEQREKVLIFSQYVECLKLLASLITNNFDETALLYHGGLGPKTRAEIVDSFQTNAGKRIMLVSLKAGGLGLNLTAASRVIHFDLWFNPAVESQATDRAFRIGQTRTVFVHRLITANSFEERINTMLLSKRELADLTVGTGETWLSKLGQADLESIFV